MIEDDDAILGELLRRQAPPARDPLFRLEVYERRERALFRWRALLSSAFVLAALVAAAVGAGAMGSGPSSTARVLFFGVLLALAGGLYGPRLARLLPFIRR